MQMTPERTGEFDTAGSEHQIVAVFETYDRAVAARDRLAEEGIPTSEMNILNRDTAGTGTEEETDEGVWASIRRLFVPDEDRHGFAEGLDRGHAVLSVQPRSGESERIVAILETLEPIDFDSRMAEWRTSGWSGRSAYGEDATSRVALSERPGPDTGGMMGQTEETAPLGAARDQAPMAGASRESSEHLAGTHSPDRAGTEEVIPVVEEQVRVGKRAVQQGNVRVRSYVVERPVEEEVALHQENVDVDRRPVDRATDVPADAFRERTIEATTYAEEPVVQKEARVVEEVALRKQSSERTEKVSDTARKTEVEVDDGRTKPAPRP